MPRTVTAHITPAVLAWARRTAGLSAEAAARKVPVTVDRLRDWEQPDAPDSAKPTVAQLRKLARAYRRPLALFFLPAPPADFQAMHDFRRLPGMVAGTRSPGLRLELRKAAARREIAIELRAALGWEIRPFDLRATLDDDPESVGERLRSWLGISADAPTQWRSGYDTFNHWRSIVERADVLVCQMTDVELDEARGFAIAEDRLPVVCVNIKDPPVARCFSLFHELVHVLLRRGGLCDLDDHSSRPAEDLRAERFCNSCAAVVLMPRDALLREAIVHRYTRNAEWADGDLSVLANRHSVSREALVRRLVTLGRVSERFYQRKRAQYRADYDRAQRAADGGFAPPDRIALSATGPSFARTVLESYHRDRITASDLADFLDVRLKHVASIESALASLSGVE